MEPPVEKRATVSDVQSAIDLCKAISEKSPHAIIAEKQEMIIKIQSTIDTIQEHLRKLADPATTQEAVPCDIQEKPRHLHHCRACFAPATAVCGRCRLIPYCSRECQRADWPLHKLLCPDPESKCAREHIELHMETWSLRKVRAAVEEGRVDPRELVQFAEKTETSGEILGVCPVLAIAVIRADVRMVEYLIAKGATVCIHMSIAKNRCSCKKKPDSLRMYDIIERVACHILRVVIHTCDRRITRARFAQYVSRTEQCLRLVVKASSNPKKEFARLQFALGLFAGVDFIAAIMGCRSQLTAMIIENCNCKELVETSYEKFAYLHAMDSYANVKISIIDDESGDKLAMLPRDNSGLEQFAHVALGRMVTGETDIRYDYHKSEVQPKKQEGHTVSVARGRGAAGAIEIQKVRAGSRTYHK